MRTEWFCGEFLTEFRSSCTRARIALRESKRIRYETANGFSPVVVFNDITICSKFTVGRRPYVHALTRRRRLQRSRKINAQNNNSVKTTRGARNVNCTRCARKATVSVGRKPRARNHANRVRASFGAGERQNS